jgi:Flavodoxins
MKKTLVAYFSASGVTAKVAKNLAKAADADLYEIRPKTPYTAADLNWIDKQARSTIEMHNKSFRPELLDHDANISKYDVVYVGFPIWWYVAPTIINTFLESYDFSGKTIVLFATSGGSGFGNTVKELEKSCEGAKIIEGRILKSTQSENDLKEWIETLDI